MSATKTESGQTRSQPGQDLKHARERSGVSIQYVSEQTKITQSRLEALEKEDYEQIGGTAYVTGYTRAYCKVLDIDPKPFVEAFEHHIEAAHSQAGSATERPSENTMKMAPSQAMLIAVLVGFVLLIGVLWYVFSDDSAPPAAPLPAPQEDIQNEADSVTGVPAVTLQASSTDDAASAVSEDDTEFESNEFEPTNQMDETNGIAELGEAESLPMSDNETRRIAVDSRTDEDETSAGTEAFNVAADVPARANGTSPEPENLRTEPSPPQTAATPGTDVLTLAFEEECWLEIREASGKRLAARLAVPGEQLRFVGRAPFSVKLGNARAASVFFNGDPVSFQVRPGARTLKLAVGP